MHSAAKSDDNITVQRERERNRHRERQKERQRQRGIKAAEKDLGANIVANIHLTGATVVSSVNAK